MTSQGWYCGSSELQDEFLSAQSNQNTFCRVVSRCRAVCQPGPDTNGKGLKLTVVFRNNLHFLSLFQPQAPRLVRIEGQ